MGSVNNPPGCFSPEREVTTAFCCEIENAKQKFLLRHVAKDEACLVVIVSQRNCEGHNLHIQTPDAIF